MFLKFLSQYEISTLNIKFPIWKCKPNPKFESEFPCINIAGEGGSGGGDDPPKIKCPLIFGI